MNKRAVLIAIVIVAMVAMWMRPQKRNASNANARGFIMEAQAQTTVTGGGSGGTTVGSFSANCLPVAPTATTLNCSALTDSGTTLTSTEFLIVPATSSASVVGGIGSATNGQGLNFGSQLQFMSSGARNAALSGANFILGTAGTFGFSNTGSDALGSSQDTFLRKRAAANWALGTTDVNGVPVAQTISVQNAITGTDLPGSLFSLVGSLGTGAGLPAPVSIKGADQSVATGATAQTGIHRLVVGDTKNLTTGAATTVLSIPLATLQMAGATITYHMEATDGTNQCTRDGVMTFSAENSAGVFVTNLTNSAGANDSTACTATKTLTEAWAVTSANPALVQVTPTLTGITATRFSLNYSVIYGGNTQPTL